MRRILLSLIAVAVMVSVATSAHAAQKNKKGKGDAVSNILAKFDKNGDGALQPDEFAAFVAAREARREAAGKSAPKVNADDLFKKLDKNGDGKLDASELAEMGKQLHARQEKKKNAT
jgi:Ca2+-binding EF-hand superfamily protein